MSFSRSKFPLKGCSSSKSPEAVADQVHGLALPVVDVRARRVEVGVTQHHLPGLDQQAHHDVLGRAPLVRRDDVRVLGDDVVHRLLEPEEAGRAHIRLVTSHHPRPLHVAHRAGAAIRHQIDEHVLGVEVDVGVEGLLQPLFPLRPGEQTDLLHHLDPEGLHKGLHLKIEIFRRAHPGSPSESGTEPALAPRATRCQKSRQHPASGLCLRHSLAVAWLRTSGAEPVLETLLDACWSAAQLVYQALTELHPEQRR